MLIVHHLDNSRSQRILWLLEELGLDYEVVYYSRDRATMRAPDALRLVHPLGKSPILEEDGVLFVESGAIIEHLVMRSRRLGPPDDEPGARRWSMFLHYAEGSLMPPLLALLIDSRLPGKPTREPLLAMFADHLVFLDSELAERDWFAGDELSAADVMLSFPLEAACHRAGLDHRYPRLLDWLARIHARPAYRRALERGGPYAFA